MIAFTVAMIMAAKFGAERDDVLKMQEISSKVVSNYH